MQPDRVEALLQQLLTKLDKHEQLLLRLSGKSTGNDSPEMDYMTVSEASAFCKLSPFHLRRAIGHGDLPAVNVGLGARPAYRISKSDLRVWMLTAHQSSVLR